MDQWRTSFMGALSPVLMLSRCVGVFALDRSFNFSKLLYLYGIFIGVGCLAYRIVHILLLFDTQKGNLVVLGSVFLSQISLLLCWLVFYFKTPKSELLKQAVLGLVKSLPGEDVFRYPWVCYSVLALKLVRFLLLLMTRSLTFYRIYIAFLNILCHVAVDVLLVQFATITNLTLQIINHHYQSLDSLSFKKNGDPLKGMYSVCCLYRSVNAFYAPHILVGFCNFYVSLPPFSYVAAASTNVNNHFVFFLVSEIFESFYVAFVTVSSCNSLKRKVKAFNEKVYEKTRSDQEILEQDNIKLFVAYQPKVRPKCATFNIDYPVLIQLVVTCLTYVVILLQFGNRYITKEAISTETSN